MGAIVSPIDVLKCAIQALVNTFNREVPILQRMLEAQGEKIRELEGKVKLLTSKDETQ